MFRRILVFAICCLSFSASAFQFDESHDEFEYYDEPSFSEIMSVGQVVEARVGLVINTFADGLSTHCVGNIIGDEMVLVPATCLIRFQKGVELPVSSTFDPGLLRNEAPSFNREYVSGLWLPKFLGQLLDGQNRSVHRKDLNTNNFAILFVPALSGRKAVGDRLGDTTFKALTNVEIPHREISVYGYKADGTGAKEGLWRTDCYIQREVNPSLGYHITDCPLNYAFLGSGVYVRQSNSHIDVLVGFANIDQFERKVVVTPISETYAAEIKKVVDTKHIETSVYKYHPMQRDAYNRLIVENNCTEILYVATVGFISGSFVDRGWMPIEPGQTAVVGRSKSKNIYYYVSNEAGTRTWAGKEKRHVGSSVNAELMMNKFDFGEFFQDSRVKLNCR